MSVGQPQSAKGNKLWEILVPTVYEDTKKPIKTRHHRVWDKYVRSLSKGLTLMSPAKGQWVYQGQIYTDRVIPVRIACSDNDMKQIARFSLKHYRQISIMYYAISNEVYFCF